MPPTRKQAGNRGHGQGFFGRGRLGHPLTRGGVVLRDDRGTSDDEQPPALAPPTIDASGATTASGAPRAQAPSLPPFEAGQSRGGGRQLTFAQFPGFTRPSARQQIQPPIAADGGVDYSARGQVDLSDVPEFRNIEIPKNVHDPNHPGVVADREAQRAREAEAVAAEASGRNHCDFDGNALGVVRPPAEQLPNAGASRGGTYQGILAVALDRCLAARRAAGIGTNVARAEEAIGLGGEWDDDGRQEVIHEPTNYDRTTAESPRKRRRVHAAKIVAGARRRGAGHDVSLPIVGRKETEDPPAECTPLAEANGAESGEKEGGAAEREEQDAGAIAEGDAVAEGDDIFAGLAPFAETDDISDVAMAEEGEEGVAEVEDADSDEEDSEAEDEGHDDGEPPTQQRRAGRHQPGGRRKRRRTTGGRSGRGRGRGRRRHRVIAARDGPRGAAADGDVAAGGGERPYGYQRERQRTSCRGGTVIERVPPLLHQRVFNEAAATAAANRETAVEAAAERETVAEAAGDGPVEAGEEDRAAALPADEFAEGQDEDVGMALAPDVGNMEIFERLMMEAPVPGREDDGQNFSAEVAEVMNARLGVGSWDAYRRSNTLLCIWLLDYFPSSLEPGWARAFWDAHQRDISDGVSETTRRSLRATVWAALNAYDFTGGTCPVDLAMMTFPVFGQYLVAVRRLDGEFHGSSSYEGKRTSLMHLFDVARHEMDPLFYADLHRLMSGIKRRLSRRNQQLGRRVQVGKNPLTYAAYHLICEWLVEESSPEYIFAWCFITLAWSLMARADNTKRTHLSHLKFEDDCLKFYFAHKKCDQEGINANEPYHVYGNAHDFVVSPHLAMAVYLCTHDAVLNGNNKLFGGSDPYGRFSEILKKLCNRPRRREALMKLGCDLRYFGTHSIRKGSGTYICAGCTVSPPIVSVCLRADWSIGSVKERYLHYEKAGDQFVGRCCTGIDVCSSDFAVSCPYFEGGEEVDAALDEYIEEVAPLALDNVKTMLRYLLASLDYHRAELEEVTKADHPIRRSVAWRLIPEALRGKAVVRYPWNKTAKTPEITGVPPHTTILSRLEYLKEAIDDLPKKVVAALRQEVGLNVGGVNVEALVRTLAQNHQEMMNKLDAMANRDLGRLGEADGGAARVTTAERAAQRQRAAFRAHFWGSQMQIVPRDWKFPKKMTAYEMIRNYFIGDDEEGIPPYRVLVSGFVRHDKRGSRKLNEMRKFMDRVELLGREKGVWLENENAWTRRSCAELYEAVKDDLIPPLTDVGHARRQDDISWRTVVDIIRDSDKKAKAQAELEEDDDAELIGE